MKKVTHSCVFHIVWDTKDREDTSELLEGTSCGADVTLCRMNVPCSPGSLTRSCNGQGGNITAKSLAAQSIATSASAELRSLLPVCLSHFEVQAPQGRGLPAGYKCALS